MRWLLIACMVLSSIPAYALQYFENCDSITDWTDADAGNGASTQATFDSKSTMKLYVPTASGTSSAIRQIDAIPLTTNFIAEIGVYCDLLGAMNTTNINFFRLNINRTTTHSLGIAWASDGLFSRTAASTYSEIGADLVSLDAWETWRFFFNTTTNKVWVWKNGVFVGGDIACGFSTTGATAGRVALAQYGFTTNGTLSYVDYLRIYSEDGQLIQTIIE